jgi:hypothetical protein
MNSFSNINIHFLLQNKTSKHIKTRFKGTHHRTQKLYKIAQTSEKIENECNIPQQLVPNFGVIRVTRQ